MACLRVSCPKRLGSLEVKDLERTRIQVAVFHDKRKRVSRQVCRLLEDRTQAFLCKPPGNQPHHDSLDLTKVDHEQEDYTNSDYVSVCAWTTYYQGPCGGQNCHQTGRLVIGSGGKQPVVDDFIALATNSVDSPIPGAIYGVGGDKSWKSPLHSAHPSRFR